jgi:hypothetical protein
VDEKESARHLDAEVLSGLDIGGFWHGSASFYLFSKGNSRRRDAFQCFFFVSLLESFEEG